MLLCIKLTIINFIRNKQFFCGYNIFKFNLLIILLILFKHFNIFQKKIKKYIYKNFIKLIN
jgi:hypothetical protein